MAHRVDWSRRALQDLESIAKYIATDSPTYAGIVVKKIVSHVKTLAKFPRIGRKVPEFDDENIRELLVQLSDYLPTPGRCSSNCGCNPR
jgi:plasmid stabilization system protein ParE